MNRVSDDGFLSERCAGLDKWIRHLCGLDRAVWRVKGRSGVVPAPIALPLSAANLTAIDDSETFDAKGESPAGSPEELSKDRAGSSRSRSLPRYGGTTPSREEASKLLREFLLEQA